MNLSQAEGGGRPGPSTHPVAWDLRLPYDRPAAVWAEGLPLGNGRAGAMVYGGVRAERVYLSETTFWSGEPSSHNNPPHGPAIVDRVRQHLLAGEVAAANDEAELLIGRKLNYGTNLPFGNLRLYCGHMETAGDGYRRELDLDGAIATVSYEDGGVQYRREMFLSAVDQVLVVRLTADRSGSLTLRVALDGDEQPHTVGSVDDDQLVMTTWAREHQHSDGRVGVEGHARVKVKALNGRVSALGSHLVVERADDVIILVAWSTTFGGADPGSFCDRKIQAADFRSYDDLISAHIAEHRGWFRRSAIDLGPNPHPDWPIDRRIDAVRKGAVDPHLCALQYQLGRYMILCSSRPDSPLPADLLGAWNDNKAARIDWTCDCHLDINTQMNYWITELSGLGDCQQPLFNWITNTLVPSGRATAHDLYGKPGWVAHVFSNAWGFTAWGWGTAWGVHPTGGVWAALHLWDHYDFTRDGSFLARQAYPVLKEAAEFWLANLFEDPRSGYLMTGPANSPENSFVVDGRVCAVSLCPTGDRTLIDALFTACIQASLILDCDADLRASLSAAREKLPPYRVGKHGQLQEWLEADYDEAHPGHRHTSHLLALYPFSQITPRLTPELARAARVSLQRKTTWPTYEEGAWGRNNITLFYARLHDPQAAYDSLITLFKKEAEASLLAGTRFTPAGAYELDFNTGASAAIAEMLLQSQGDRIALLPALPEVWPAGSVTGLRARGGFILDLEWRDQQLAGAHIRSTVGGPCRIEAGQNLIVSCDGAPIDVRSAEHGDIVFETKPGVTYILHSALR